MKTKCIPAIIMLTAGFIYCLVGIHYHLDLMDFTRELLIVLVVFLFVGGVVKIILDRNFAEMKEETPVEEEGETEGASSGQEDNSSGNKAVSAASGDESLENIEAADKE